MWNGVLLVCGDVLWISNMNKNKVNLSIVWACLSESVKGLA